MMRVFLAIELPRTIRKQIFAFAKQATQDFDIKLVEEENLHLTLLFLGKISQDNVSLVREALGKLMLAGKIKLRIKELEVFPSAKQAHGIWLKIGGETEKLFPLFKKLSERIISLGFDLENKHLRFSPHITLGRFRKSRSFGEINKTDLPKEEFLVKKIVLFESKLSSKGPKYSKLAEFRIK